jgi:predicted RNase H-like HicB family nuclease
MQSINYFEDNIQKKTMKKFEVIIERTNTGYSAYTDKFPVCTTGKTLQELKINMLEALNLYFECNNKPRITEDSIKISF